MAAGGGSRDSDSHAADGNLVPSVRGRCVADLAMLCPLCSVQWVITGYAGGPYDEDIRAQQPGHRLNDHQL